MTTEEILEHLRTALTPDEEVEKAVVSGDQNATVTLTRGCGVHEAMAILDGGAAGLGKRDWHAPAPTGDPAEETVSYTANASHSLATARLGAWVVAELWACCLKRGDAPGEWVALTSAPLKKGSLIPFDQPKPKAAGGLNMFGMA